MTHAFLIPSPHEADGGHLIGRDPRKIGADEWQAHMPDAVIGMKAIRAKCLDCAGGQYSEVTKCTAVGCALWPLRTGSQPKGLREYRKSLGDTGDDSQADEVAA